MTNIVDFRKHKHMSKKGHKTTDPAELARLAGRGAPPETWGPNEAALKLDANAEVDVTFERGMPAPRRVRYDVFALLFHTPASRLAAQSYDAVRRYQTDLAILHRTQGASDAIRATGAGQTGAIAMVTADFAAVRVQAGERIAKALERMTKPNARLLQELCDPEVIAGRIPNWHAIVQRLRGETDRRKRGAHVIDACDDLAAAYREIDNAQPERSVA